MPLNGSVLALSFSAAVVVFGFGIILPFLPLYAGMLGATTGLQIGILSSSFLFTRIFLAAPAGSASDRVGRKRMIIFGLLMYSIVSVLFAISQAYYELLFYRALQGVASAMVWPAATALVGDLTPPGQRGSAMGVYNSISMVGYMIGPSLGAGIVWYATQLLNYTLTESYRLTFFLSSLVSIASALMVYFFVNVPVELKPVKRPLMKFSLKGLDPVFRRTIFIVFLFVLAYGFATSFIEPLLVWFIKYDYGLSDATVTYSTGIIFTVSSAVSIGVTFLAGRLADRFSKKRLIGVPTIAAQLLTMLMPYASNITNLGIVMTARTASYSLTSPAYSALQQDLLPQKVRGAFTGVFDTFFGIGSFIGPIVSFSIYDGISHRLPFIVSGLLGLLTVVLLVVLVKEPTIKEAKDISLQAGE